MVFTKVASAPRGSGYRPDDIPRAAEASLRRLRRDVLDLYQLHWVDENDAVLEDTWGAMAALVDAGLARWIGVSNFAVDGSNAASGSGTWIASHHICRCCGRSDRLSSTSVPATAPASSRTGAAGCAARSVSAFRGCPPGDPPADREQLLNEPVHLQAGILTLESYAQVAHLSGSSLCTVLVLTLLGWRGTMGAAMIITQTILPGAYVIDLEPIEDDRGFFARAWSEQELSELGLDTRVVQCNISFNVRKGTLRGMHFQRPPHEEVKTIRCIRGAVFDVIVDLRRDSPTYRRWTGVELSAENRKMLYVPGGFAHGLQALDDATEVFYLVSAPYTPEAEGGVRWDDPAFGIEWPLDPPTVISDKDASWPDFEP